MHIQDKCTKMSCTASHQPKEHKILILVVKVTHVLHNFVRERERCFQLLGTSARADAMKY